MMWRFAFKVLSVALLINYVIAQDPVEADENPEPKDVEKRSPDTEQVISNIEQQLGSIVGDSNSVPADILGAVSEGMEVGGSWQQKEDSKATLANVNSTKSSQGTIEIKSKGKATGNLNTERPPLPSPLPIYPPVMPPVFPRPIPLPFPYPPLVPQPQPPIHPPINPPINPSVIYPPIERDWKCIGYWLEKIFGPDSSVTMWIERLRDLVFCDCGSALRDNPYSDSGVQKVRNWFDDLKYTMPMGSVIVPILKAPVNMVITGYKFGECMFTCYAWRLFKLHLWIASFFPYTDPERFYAYIVEDMVYIIQHVRDHHLPFLPCQGNDDDDMYGRYDPDDGGYNEYDNNYPQYPDVGGGGGMYLGTPDSGMYLGPNGMTMQQYNDGSSMSMNFRKRRSIPNKSNRKNA